MHCREESHFGRQQSSKEMVRFRKARLLHLLCFAPPLPCASSVCHATVTTSHHHGPFRHRGRVEAKALTFALAFLVSVVAAPVQGFRLHQHLSTH